MDFLSKHKRKFGNIFLYLILNYGHWKMNSPTFKCFFKNVNSQCDIENINNYS